MTSVRSPLGARLAAALVAAITLEALAFDTWPAVAAAAFAALLDVPTRRSPYAFLAGLVTPEPYPLRPARPAARAALLRAVGLACAAVLLALDVAVVGVALGALVSAEALVDAIGGRCGICLVMRRRRGAVGALGLDGGGPWLVGIGTGESRAAGEVLARLDDAAREPVVRIDLLRHPRAGALARVVPAAVAVELGGEVRARLEGPRAPEDISAFLERLRG